MCNTCGCKSAENFEANEWFEENRTQFKDSKRRIKSSPYDYNPVCSHCGMRMFAIGPYEMIDGSRIGNKYQDDFFVMGCRNEDCTNYGYGAETFGAYDDSISERQEWLIGELGGKVDKSMNRSKASDYIKELQGKESGTWKSAETFEAEDDYILLEDYEGEGVIVCSNDKEKVRTFLRNSFMGLRLNFYQPHELYGMGLDLEILENEGVEHPTIQEQLLNWFDSQTFAKQITWGGFRDESKVLKSGGFYTQGDAYIEPLTGFFDNFVAEGESKRKGSHTPNIQLVNYEDVLREKMKNQNMKDAETFEAEKYGGLMVGDSLVMMNLTGLEHYQVGFDNFGMPLHRLDKESQKELINRMNKRAKKTRSKRVQEEMKLKIKLRKDNDFTFVMGDEYADFDAETFEANEEAVEQTDANMVNEGSVEAFYGGGAKVSVSSAGIQPTANPSVDEAFDVGNQVGLDVAEQEIMNENPSVEVNYGAENDDDDYEHDCMNCGEGIENEKDALKMGYELLCYSCQHEYTDDELEEALKSYDSENMSLRESAKLGFGVGAGLLGFNVALLGIATIGGFLLNRD